MICRKIYCTQTRTLSKIYSNLQKTVITNVKEKLNRDVILITLENKQISSIEDWTDVRKAILEHEINRGQYTNHNIDAMIVGHCVQTNQYDLGVSYVEFLNKEKIKPNLATTGKYLKLIYLKNLKNYLETGKGCTKNEEHLIISYYEQLRKDYPFLDSITLENIVQALSLTSRWRDCINLLEDIKVTAVPSMSAYSATVASAFINKEEELGWKLLDEMLGYDKIPINVAYLAYLNFVSKQRKKSDKLNKLEKLFLFWQANSLKCDEEVAVKVAEVGKKLGYEGNFTTVIYRGVCKSCAQSLNSFNLTDEEFNELKNKLFEKVIVGRDVFIKTTPVELERFKTFTEGMGQFDVVIDGLNVAYSSGTKHSVFVTSSLVASVVSHFVQQRKKVLVLGRAHMERWPRKNWDYVKQNAKLFLAEDISQDDPYLLYCALSSGKHTIIVTRDLMRGHKFLLRDPRLKSLFNRWLSQRQYQLVRVDDRKKPIFRIPPPFSVVAQCNRGVWHVPYETDEPKDNSDFHRRWLCLKVVKKT